MGRAVQTLTTSSTLYLCCISCLGSELTFLQLHSFMLFYLLLPRPPTPMCQPPTFTWRRHTLIDECGSEAGALLKCCPAATKKKKKKRTKKSRIKRNLEIKHKDFHITNESLGARNSESRFNERRKRRTSEWVQGGRGVLPTAAFNHSRALTW